MIRIFTFSVPQLKFLKRDLNISSSLNRRIIGKLARIITNTIFLSHSLRNNTIIRIFVDEPFQHVYEINSKKIRYLGPELRSFASLVRKSENKLLEMGLDQFKSRDWYQTNPGLFCKFSSTPFIDLDKKIKKPIFFLKQTIYKKSDNEQKLFDNLVALENHILNSKKKYNTFIYSTQIEFDDSKNLHKLSDYFLEKNIPSDLFSIQLQRNYDVANIVSIINLILDEKEKEGI